MTDYLTLAEADAGRATVYTAAPVNKASMRAVFERMAERFAAGETSLHNALERAGDNTDNGATYVCAYDLRRACGERLAASASALRKAGEPNAPADIVKRAIDRLDAPAVAAPVELSELPAA